MKPVIATILIAANLLSTGASAQFDLKNTAVTSCPEPDQVSPQHVYGLWRAQFAGLSQGATLLFEKHPEWAGSVSGAINRNGERARISADIEQGEFSLEESSDGVQVSAVWHGAVVAGSCGKEIRGTWNSAANRTLYPFVLSKLPGWQ
jgi:hypothetical protein